MQENTTDARAIVVVIELQPDEILVALKRPEGYDEVHPELVAEDAIKGTWPEYRTITQSHGATTESRSTQDTSPVVPAPMALPIDPSLAQRCREILHWQSTGVLGGNALRDVARDMNDADDLALQRAEEATKREALRLVVALFQQGQAVETVLRRILEQANHRADGELPDLLERVEQLSGDDRALLAVQGRRIDQLHAQRAGAQKGRRRG